MIETERLTLRPWREGDNETFARHTNTPAVMRWLGPLMTPEQLAGMEERSMKLQAERGHCFWIAERRSDGEMLGFCGLKIADAPNCPMAGELEIGWRLREDTWGQGYAREAATASLDHAFDVVGADRVMAQTVVGNSASWGLMERLGMTRRPDLDYSDPRYSGELSPTIVYVLERSEWRA